MNEPKIVQHPDIRVLPLNGFDPVEVVALWHPPQSPLLASLLAAIRVRAGELWPVLEPVTSRKLKPDKGKRALR